MTDNEIIKALECCSNASWGSCHDCPYREKLFPNHCTFTKNGDAIALINRLKAEIERLQKYHDSMEEAIYSFREDQAEVKFFKDRIRAEAIKEFAERVHTEIEAAITSNRKVITDRVSRGVNPYEDEFCKYCHGKVHALVGIDDYIADLVKEFTEEQK